MGCTWTRTLRRKQFGCLSSVGSLGHSHRLGLTEQTVSQHEPPFDFESLLLFLIMKWQASWAGSLSGAWKAKFRVQGWCWWLQAGMPAAWEHDKLRNISHSWGGISWWPFISYCGVGWFPVPVSLGVWELAGAQMGEYHSAAWAMVGLMLLHLIWVMEDIGD